MQMIFYRNLQVTMMLSPSFLLVILLHVLVDVSFSSPDMGRALGHDSNCELSPSALKWGSAGYDRRLKLLGVSTVAGNQTVDKVTLNALGVLTAAGLRDIRELSA